jgi:CRP-like cAMP-binding protein
MTDCANNHIDTLRGCPLFANLPAERLARLAAATQERHYAAGETLLDKGDHPVALLLVKQGRLKETCFSPHGEERIIEILGPDRCCGEAALAPDTPMPFSVIALSDATVLHIDRHPLLEFAADPEFAMGLITALSGRILSLIHDVEAFTLQPPVQRVAGYLSDLIQPLKESDSLALPAAKKVIASRLGMTPEAFSRALRDLADAGLLEVSLRRIAIKQRQRLRDFAAS